MSVLFISAQYSDFCLVEAAALKLETKKKVTQTFEFFKYLFYQTGKGAKKRTLTIQPEKD